MAALIAKKLVLILALLLVFLGSTSFLPGRGNIPVTRAIDFQLGLRLPRLQPLPADLLNFASSVQDGQASQLVGVYAENSFAIPVVQQPADQPLYVSDEPGVVTLFGMPARYGTTGILAHNTLAGYHFASLQLGQKVALVYGTGKIRFYTVTEIHRFKAYQPDSPYSTFTDLTGDQKQQMTSGDLFNQMYTRGNQLVLQTCIDQDGNPSWGRLFIVATPAA